jgi:hypothetical protein
LTDEGTSEGVGPSRSFALSADGDVWSCAFEDVAREFAEDGEVFGGMILAVSGAIFVENRVEHPVHAIFDGSKGANGLGESFGSPPSR